MKKRGMLWGTIGKWLFALALLVVILIIIGVLTGGMDKLWTNIKNILTFGG